MVRPFLVKGMVRPFLVNGMDGDRTHNYALALKHLHVLTAKNINNTISGKETKS